MAMLCEKKINLHLRNETYINVAAGENGFSHFPLKNKAVIITAFVSESKEP